MFLINFLFYEHSWDTSMGLLIIMLIMSILPFLRDGLDRALLATLVFLLHGLFWKNHVKLKLSLMSCFNEYANKSALKMKF